MKVAKVMWMGREAGPSTRHEGELPALDEDTKLTLPDLETSLFETVKDKNLHYLALRVEWPDGSGKLCHYEKRGDTWMRTFADNIVPWWFPWITFGLLFGGLAICVILLAILGR